MELESNKEEKYELQLTEFQLSSLSNLVQQRQRALKQEQEFVVMCIKAAGMTIDEGAFVEVKEGKLKWTKNEKS